MKIGAIGCFEAGRVGLIRSKKIAVGGGSFRELTPPSFFDFRHTPPGHLWLSTSRCGVPTASRGTRLDLKVGEGGGGVLFRKRGGVRRQHMSAHPPITTVPCFPSKLIERTRVARLPLRVTSGGGGSVTRYARFSAAR